MPQLTSNRLATETDRVYSLRGIAYNDKGQYDKDQYDKAIADFTNAIRLYQHDAHIFYSRGKACKMKDDVEKADEDFAKAKELGYKPRSAKE